MKILWITWKDISHPQAGGAEVINDALAEKLVQDGHEVIMIVGAFQKSKAQELIHGYTVIRVGNRWSVYLKAYLYYSEKLKGWEDIVIEEINTIPFFTQWYTKGKKILLFYQLCREIWFYQIGFPFNLIGYLLEPIYLLLLRRNKVLTESESTKKDLQKYGFKKENIQVFPVSIDIKPIQDLHAIKKSENFTLLSVGSMRAMKRTQDQIKAFEIVKETIPEAKFIIAGDASSAYGRDTLKMIKMSPYKNDITYLGKITEKEKQKYMQKSHLILVTSVKEGWGLIVTEAASQGTPAVVYDVDGLRDAVINKKTGLISQKNSEDLAKKIIEIYKNKSTYKKLQKNALQFSREFSRNKSYNEFITFLS